MAALILAWAATPADAALSRDEVAKQVAETYNVEVLKVREGEVDGRAVWWVTFMVPGGDVNGAWAVFTVAVDRESGRLLPGLRHRASGYELPPAPRLEEGPRRPDAARMGGIWR